MNGSKTRPRLRLVSLLLLPALLAACSSQSGSKGPTFGAGITGTATNGLFSLTVNINPNTVGRGGSAGITVVAQTPNGIPLKGKSVQMSTTGGILASVAGTTDAAGKFVTSITIPEDFDSTVTSVDVSATVDGLTAKATLNINSLGALAIVPASAILAPGTTQFFNCTGGVPPYKWESSGGTINVSSGPSVIYTAGSQLGGFALKCTDAAGSAVSAQITISGNVAGSLTVTPSSVTLAPKQAQNFQASGGVPPYNWSFPAGAGSLSTPSGPSTTLTAGVTSGKFTLILTDSIGQTASATVSIEVPKLTLLPSNVTRTFQATGKNPGTCDLSKVTVTLTVTGGVPLYTFSATTGTVTPQTRNTSGDVSYAPQLGSSVAGGFTTTETVTVVDSVGGSATSTINITCTLSSATSGPVPMGRRPIGVSGR